MSYKIIQDLQRLITLEQINSQISQGQVSSQQCNGKEGFELPFAAEIEETRI